MLDSLNRGMDYFKALVSLNKLIKQTLDMIQSKYEWWSRTEGRDHIFILPSERGPSLLQVSEEVWPPTRKPSHLSRVNVVLRKSIFMVSVAQRGGPRGGSYATTWFDSWKDIVVPSSKASYDSGFEGLIKGWEGEREYLIHFRGSIPGAENGAPRGVRSVLAANLYEEEDIMFNTASNDGLTCDANCTRNVMRKAIFCLCPSCVEGCDARVFLAAMNGCIPVIIADDYEFPFENVLSYPEFTVKIAEERAEDVAELLRSISKRRIHEKKQALNDVEHRYLNDDSESGKAPKEGDALEMILEILVTKRRFMRNSPYRFWKSSVSFG